MHRRRYLESLLLLLFIIFIVSIFTTPNNVYAQEIVSTQEGGLWNKKGTWLGGVVPTEYDDVVIKGRVTIGSDIIVRNIYIDGNGELDSSSRIDRDLYLEGEHFENRGYISSRVVLHAPSYIINFGDIDSTIYLKEGTYSIEGVIKKLHLKWKYSC